MAQGPTERTNLAPPAVKINKPALKILSRLYIQPKITITAAQIVKSIGKPDLDTLACCSLKQAGPGAASYQVVSLFHHGNSHLIRVWCPVTATTLTPTNPTPT
jgi:hypothetical protein